MAQAYAKLIKSSTTTTTTTNHSLTPIVLGGWSFGGVVAFEAARVLQAEGHAVSGVVLIDSPPPLNHKPLSEAIINDVVKSGGGGGPGGKSDVVRDTIRSLARQSFTSCASMLERHSKTPEAVVGSNGSKAAPRVFLLRSKNDFILSTEKKTNNNNANNGGSGGGKRIIDNAWLQDRSDPRTAISGWETVTGGAKVPSLDIPGNHFQPFDAANVS